MDFIRLLQLSPLLWYFFPLYFVFVELKARGSADTRNNPCL